MSGGQPVAWNTAAKAPRQRVRQLRVNFRGPSPNTYFCARNDEAWMPRPEELLQSRIERRLDKRMVARGITRTSKRIMSFLNEDAFRRRISGGQPEAWNTVARAPRQRVRQFRVIFLGPNPNIHFCDCNDEAWWRPFLIYKRRAPMEKMVEWVARNLETSGTLTGHRHGGLQTSSTWSSFVSRGNRIQCNGFSGRALSLTVMPISPLFDGRRKDSRSSQRRD